MLQILNYLNLYWLNPKRKELVFFFFFFFVKNLESLSNFDKENIFSDHYMKHS